MLVGPTGPDVPLVLIIPGSGPTNRDGNAPRMGVDAAPLRLLAEGFAAKDISSIRIDKRGLFASASGARNAEDVSLEDYADDVRRWIGVAQAETVADCVWLAGHSEGGLVALAAAQDERICGLISLATPGREAGELIMTQLRANPAMAPFLDRAERTMAELETGRPTDMSDMPVALQPLFRPSIERFLRSLLAFDPLEAAARSWLCKAVAIFRWGRKTQRRFQRPGKTRNRWRSTT